MYGDGDIVDYVNAEVDQPSHSHPTLKQCLPRLPHTSVSL